MTNRGFFIFWCLEFWTVFIPLLFYCNYRVLGLCSFCTWLSLDFLAVSLMSFPRPLHALLVSGVLYFGWFLLLLRLYGHYHQPHGEAWLSFCSALWFVSDFKPNRAISSILKVNKVFHIIKLEKMFHGLLQVLLWNLNHTESLSCSLYQSPPGLSLSLLTLKGKKNPFDSQFSVSLRCASFKDILVCLKWAPPKHCALNTGCIAVTGNVFESVKHFYLNL